MITVRHDFRFSTEICRTLMGSLKRRNATDRTRKPMLTARRVTAAENVSV